MKQLVLVSAALLALAATSSRCSASTPGACSRPGHTAVDGCLTAPTLGLYSEQFSSLTLGYAQQSLSVSAPGWSSTVVQANPYPFWGGAGNGFGGADSEWNVAGEAYPVGVDAALHPSLTPAISGGVSQVPGCTAASANELDCTSAGTLTIDGYDFSVNGGISLYIAGPTSCTLTNNYFVMGPRSASYHASAGGWINLYMGSCTSGITVNKNRFQGKTGVVVGQADANSALQQQWILIKGNGTSAAYIPIVFEYNDFSSGPRTPFATTSCYINVTMKYNLFNGFNSNEFFGNHGDLPLLNCSNTGTALTAVGSFVFDFNTIVQGGLAGGVNAAGCITPFITNAGGPNIKYGNIEIQYNSCFTNITKASGGPWNTVNISSGGLLTIGDTSYVGGAFTPWEGGFLYDTTHAIASGTQFTKNISSLTPTGTIGQYTLSATVGPLGSQNNNHSFTASPSGTTFFGFVASSTGTGGNNVLYVTQMISGGPVNLGTDTITDNSGGCTNCATIQAGVNATVAFGGAGIYSLSKSGVTLTNGIVTQLFPAGATGIYFGSLQAVAGTVSIAHNRFDTTGIFPNDCVDTGVMANPVVMFISQPTISDNEAVQFPNNGSADITSNTLSHSLGISIASNNGSGLLTLTFASSDTFVGGGVMAVSGGSGWPSDWNGNLIIPPGATDGTFTNPADNHISTGTKIIVQIPTSGESWTSGGSPGASWWTAYPTACPGTFLQ